MGVTATVAAIAVRPWSLVSGRRRGGGSLPSRHHVAIELAAGEHEERDRIEKEREREDLRGSHRRKEFAAASRCLRRRHSSSLLSDAVAVREEERELALPLDPPFLTVSVAAVSALLLPPLPRGATPLCFWPPENLVAVAEKTLPVRVYVGLRFIWVSGSFIVAVC
ncbi:uncharacterized protein DS421_10g312020 [Arachis hypogaea]|nr:uncharacterized protein DS421_10g312020 [Arachis hypogaea]